MIKEFIIIRIKQSFRALIGIGLIRLFFIVGLITFLASATYIVTAEQTNATYFSAGYIILLLSIQVRRNDKLFLKSHFSNYKLIIAFEYFTASIPLFICLILHAHYLAIGAITLGILTTVHLDIKPTKKSINTKLQHLIPPDCIEWKAGVRKYFFIIVPTWIIAALTSYFIASIPIAIFIISMVILSFFEHAESYQILQSYQLSSKHFIWHKVKRQIILFSIVTLPLIGLFTLFHLYTWYIPFVEFLIFIFLQIYIIMTKYAFYEPNTKSTATQTFGAIGILGGIIPVFLPLVWILTIWFYIKSIKQLNYYLHDYN